MKHGIESLEQRVLFALPVVPDPTFSGDGTVNPVFSPDVGGVSDGPVKFVHVLADGKILAGGFSREGGGARAARFNPDGSRDMFFGTGGLSPAVECDTIFD